MQCCKDRDWNVREAALSSLGGLQSPSSEVIAVLLQGCKNTDKDVRQTALRSLGGLQSPSSEVIAVLLQGCKDTDKDVHQAALSSLGGLQSPSSEVIAVLLQGYKDTDGYVRQAALKSLGGLQSPSSEVIAVLLQGCKNTDKDVSQTALKSLGGLQSPSSEVIAVLLQGCKDTDEDVRRTVLAILGGLQIPSVEVIAVLLQGWKDGNSLVSYKSKSKLNMTILCKYYPRFNVEEQQIAMPIIKEKLQQSLTSVIYSKSTNELHFFINKQKVSVPLLHSTSLMKAIEQLRWLPALSIGSDKQLESVSSATGLQDITAGGSTLTPILHGRHLNESREKLETDRQPADTAHLSPAITGSTTTRPSSSERQRRWSSIF